MARVQIKTRWRTKMADQYTLEQLQAETMHAIRARLRAIGAGYHKTEKKDAPKPAASVARVAESVEALREMPARSSASAP